MANFGFLFDIDGVFVRGKQVLPAARDAVRLITDKAGRFRVPAVFLTNASNKLPTTKAVELSDILGVNVSLYCTLESFITSTYVLDDPLLISSVSVRLSNHIALKFYHSLIKSVDHGF